MAGRDLRAVLLSNADEPPGTPVAGTCLYGDQCVHCCWRAAPLERLGMSQPGVNSFFTGHVIKRLRTKPVAPITVPLAAVAGNASAAKVFWYGQAAHHFWDDVVKGGATGAKLLVAVGAAVITS